MAHEHIIRNGLIVESSFAFLDDKTKKLSGVTNAGVLTNKDNIVSERVIKLAIESIKMSDLSGVNYATANNDDILVFENGLWVTKPLSNISVDAYTKIESDGRYLNLSGGTLTGELTMGTNNIVTDGTVDGVDISTFKSSYDTFVGTTYVNRTLSQISDVTITSVATDDFIRWNGSAWVNVATSTILSDYYTKSEADTNFIEAIGDSTITGALTVTANLTVGNLITTGNVDGVDISTFKTDFDNRSLSGNTDVTITSVTDTQLLQYNGSQWVNVNASSVVVDAYTKNESDSKFVYTSGDTMTGELIINAGSGEKALSTTGDVNIQGDLYVSGTTVTVDVENMAISDNLLLLNSGETGAGVSRSTAGLIIDRGTLSAVTLLFDESTFTVRVGETSSSVEDNNVDISSTVALAAISESSNFGAPTNYGMMYWTNDVLSGGILKNSSTITINEGNGNLQLDGGNITMNGTETVDGVDISVFKSAYDTFVGTTYVNRTISEISDVVISSVLDNQILAYNSATTQWENIGLGDITGDFYTKSESDNRFINQDGDVMTGNLTVPSLTATTLILNSTSVGNIYDEDDMVSDSDTALATQQSIKAYVDNSITNFSLSLSGLSDVSTSSLVSDDILTYNGSSWENKTVSDIIGDKYLELTGGTLTGDLTITPLSGTGDRIVFVDTDGKLSESEEFVYKTSTDSISDGTYFPDLFLATTCKAVTWDYVIDDGTQMRAGTITAVWNGVLVEWNEVSTNDLGGNIQNNEFHFDVDISGGNIRLVATADASSIWSVDTSRQMIG